RKENVATRSRRGADADSSARRFRERGAQGDRERSARSAIGATMAEKTSTLRASAPLDLSGFADWLVERGLRGLPLDGQVEGFCRRIVDAGFTARRFNMSLGTQHPRHGARSYVWRPTGLETESFARRRSDEQLQGYLASPIYYLRRTGETVLRRRLDADAQLDFPVLVDLRDTGMTDYAARIVRFDSSSPKPEGSGALDVLDRRDALQGIFF